ncbi:MAG: hypothetical protein L6R35_007319, partial [Caloplaca aegaea]
MRFRANIRDEATFAKLTGSLLLLSKVVWIRLDNDQVRFTVIPERGSQVWAVLSIGSIFHDYVIQSATANNTINLQVPLAPLNRALRSAFNAFSSFSAYTASLRLTKKDNIPLLSLTMITDTLPSFRPSTVLLEPDHEPSDPGHDTAGGNDDSVSSADGPPR